MTPPPYRLDLPEFRAAGVIFASPHSGRDYPADFLRRSMLDACTIRSSEDAFVDRLFDAAPKLGAPLLSALAPRAYLDLNRGADFPAPTHLTPPRASLTYRLALGGVAQLVRAEES